jgi:class 3 adenylate cyclase
MRGALHAVWQCLAMRWGEVQYAKAGEHHIAYCEIVGDERSELEIAMVNGGFFPMESLADDPVAARFVEGLAGLGRLVMFDRRGIALSDPVSDWETSLLEQWSDDLAAVIAAAGYTRPAVFSWCHHPVARTCAIRHPKLIDRLVLYNPGGSRVIEDDNEWIAEVFGGIQRLRAGDGALNDLRHEIHPSRLHDVAFKAWLDAAGRAGASPTQARRLDEKAFAGPLPDYGEIRVPTIVLTRSPVDYVVPSEFYQRASSEIPGAELVVLPPGDTGIVGLGIDRLLAEISRYFTGEVHLPAPERQLKAIVFTDLVASTRRAVSEGDAAWKTLLDRHDAVSRIEVGSRGGEVVKTTGDGILALMPSTTAAIEASWAIRAELEHDDLQVRIGIHVGEVDRRGDDVSGLAVNTASRIMSIAEAGQILSSTVVTLTTSAAAFASIGPQKLKDIDGTWELHIVE